MNFEWIKLAKDYINSVKEHLDNFQEKGYVELSNGLKLSEAYNLDLTDFVMYLIASDNSISIDEVDVYRFLTGYGGDNMDTIKANIEESDVMSYDFQSRIPVSLRFAVNATNRIMQYNDGVKMDGFLRIYVSSFILAGREVMRSDERVAYQERRDFELYIKNLIAYIEEYSYARFEKPLENLLTEYT